MRTMLMFLLTRLCLLAFKLRYKISCEHFQELLKESKDVKKGILFLPNHPAEIDPVILTCLLWRRFSPRPLVIENFFHMKGLRWMMKLVQAIPIPSFEFSANSWKIKRAEIAKKRVVDGLRRGENFIVYPSGLLKRTGKDALGGASLVHKIIEEAGDVNIVLVRTEGLWGSMFSRALTGSTPEVSKLFIDSLKVLVKNGIFFAPRRRIRIDFYPFPKNFPLKGSRSEVNEYIESWMNRYTHKGKQVDQEPLYLVSYAFYRKTLPSAAVGKSDKQKKKSIDIPKEKKNEIFAKLAELSNNPLEKIHENMDLAADLNLDSLDIATLHAFLDQSYTIDQVSLTQLKTVHDVLEASMGLKKREEAKSVSIMQWEKWPEEKRRPKVFSPQGYTLQEAFLSAVDKMEHYIACADANTKPLSYKKMKKTALILAQRFKQYPGKYVGVLLPSSVGVYLVVLALLLAKKTPVMLNWTTGVRALNFAALLLDLEVVISARRFLDRVQTLELGTLDNDLILLEDLKESLTWKEKIRGLILAMKKKKTLMKSLDLNNLNAQDPTLILFTSGTETFPKAVPLSHKNLLSNQQAALSCVNIGAKDILYGVLPPFHSFGFSITGLLPLLIGLRAFYSPDPNDSHTMSKEIERYAPTMLCMAPSFYKNLFKVAAPKQLQSIKLFITGAERAPKEIFEFVRRLGRDHSMIEGYGITECSPVVTLCRQDQPAIGVGQPLPGVELCIIHPETDKLLQSHEMGEICIHGPNVFQGYLGKETRSAFIHINNKIWYRSGDIGLIDDNNNLILGGRLKRFIKVGGEMVSLTAIEDELIARAKKNRWTSFEDDQPKLALTGFEKYEGKPLLVLFTTFSLSQEQANKAVQESGFGKIVKISKVEKIAEIPLTGTGKIHYRLLEERLLDKE